MCNIGDKQCKGKHYLFPVVLKESSRANESAFTCFQVKQVPVWEAFTLGVIK